MRTMTEDSGGSRARFAVSSALMLALAVLVPAVAGRDRASTQSSTRPNGFAGQDTYGGKPTRLTWQLRA